LDSKPASASSVTFSDHLCTNHARSYYCQPIMEKRTRNAGPPPVEERRLVPWSAMKQGLIEEVFYFEQGSRVPSLRGRTPNMFRHVPYVYYRATASAWRGFTQNDNFAVRWSGILAISNAGLYQFSLASDEGSKLYIDNKFIINNDGIHNMKTKMSRFRCVKGQHLLRIEMFQKGGQAGMIFQYKGRDTQNRMKTVAGKALNYVAANGFKEEVFYTGQTYTTMPNLRRNAVMERVVPHVVYANTKSNWPGFSRNENFACRWTGYLNIGRGGRYSFSLISDDGSRLFISHRKVVDNDGKHSLRNKEGIINLRRKLWKLKLEYFQGKGSAGMVFRYMGHDTKNKMTYVPKKAMFVAY